MHTFHWSIHFCDIIMFIRTVCSIGNNFFFLMGIIACSIFIGFVVDAFFLSYEERANVASRGWWNQLYNLFARIIAVYIKEWEKNKKKTNNFFIFFYFDWLISIGIHLLSCSLNFAFTGSYLKENVSFLQAILFNKQLWKATNKLLAKMCAVKLVFLASTALK